MFSGIVEETAIVVGIEHELENIHLTLTCSFVSELKIDQSADVALQQIEEKQYAAAFDGDQRKPFKIGLSFSSETRRVSEWKIDIQAK